MGYRPRRAGRKNNTTQRLAAIIVTLTIAIITGGVGSFGGCTQLAQFLPDALVQRFSNASSVSTLGDIPAYNGTPSSISIQVQRIRRERLLSPRRKSPGRNPTRLPSSLGSTTSTVAEPLSPVWGKKRYPPNHVRASRMYIPAGGTRAVTTLSTRESFTTAAT